jgi:hypothetical protein
MRSPLNLSITQTHLDKVTSVSWGLVLSGYPGSSTELLPFISFIFSLLSVLKMIDNQSFCQILCYRMGVYPKPVR